MIGTVFSADRVYRYTLHRSLIDETMVHPELPKVVTFICLNPSTADERVDDPTVRRCIRFAKDWGGTQFYMLNLFAFRSTDPYRLRVEKDPVGPGNDEWINEVVCKSQLVVYAWGTNGSLFGRDEVVARLVLSATTPDHIHVLGLSKGSHPLHPLYLPAATVLKPAPQRGTA